MWGDTRKSLDWSNTDKPAGDVMLGFLVSISFGFQENHVISGNK